MASLAGSNLRGPEFSFPVSLVRRQRRMWWEWVCISQCLRLFRHHLGVVTNFVVWSRMTDCLSCEPSRCRRPFSALTWVVFPPFKAKIWHHPLLLSINWLMILKTIVCYLRIYMLNPTLLAWLVAHRWGWSFTESLSCHSRPPAEEAVLTLKAVLMQTLDMGWHGMGGQGQKEPSLPSPSLAWSWDLSGMHLPGLWESGSPSALRLEPCPFSQIASSDPPSLFEQRFLLFSSYC